MTDWPETQIKKNWPEYVRKVTKLYKHMLWNEGDDSIKMAPIIGLIELIFDKETIKEHIELRTVVVDETRFGLFLLRKAAFVDPSKIEITNAWDLLTKMWSQVSKSSIDLKRQLIISTLSIFGLSDGDLLIAYELSEGKGILIADEPIEYKKISMDFVLSKVLIKAELNKVQTVKEDLKKLEDERKKKRLEQRDEAIEEFQKFSKDLIVQHPKTIPPKEKEKVTQQLIDINKYEKPSEETIKEQQDILNQLQERGYKSTTIFQKKDITPEIEILTEYDIFKSKISNETDSFTKKLSKTRSDKLVQELGDKETVLSVRGHNNLLKLIIENTQKFEGKPKLEYELLKLRITKAMKSYENQKLPVVESENLIGELEKLDENLEKGNEVRLPTKYYNELYYLIKENTMGYTKTTVEEEQQSTTEKIDIPEKVGTLHKSNSKAQRPPKKKKTIDFGRYLNTNKNTVSGDLSDSSDDEYDDLSDSYFDNDDDDYDDRDERYF